MRRRHQLAGREPANSARQPAPAASDAKDARGQPRGFICGYLASPDITWSLDEDDLKSLEASKETGDSSEPVDHGD